VRRAARTSSVRSAERMSFCINTLRGRVLTVTGRASPSASHRPRLQHRSSPTSLEWNVIMQCKPQINPRSLLPAIDLARSLAPQQSSSALESQARLNARWWIGLSRTRFPSGATLFLSSSRRGASGGVKPPEIGELYSWHQAGDRPSTIAPCRISLGFLRCPMPGHARRASADAPTT
jgi:hypothetical protein